MENNKESRLPKLVKIFSFAFWIPFIFLALAFSFLTYEYNQGISGTEYAGILLTPVAVLVGVLGLVYLVLLIRYVRSKYPTRNQKNLAYLVILFLISLNVWQVVEIKAAISGPEKSISYEGAVELIENCKVDSIWKLDNKISIAAPYYDARGYQNRSYKTSSANWDKLISEVEKVKSKCGGIDVIGQ